MGKIADLEIGLHKHSIEEDCLVYSVEFRYSQPESETEVRLGQDRAALARFKLIQLRSLIYDSAAYGAALSEGLFSDPAVASAFSQALASANSMSAQLRLRLMIGPSAAELHALRWEALLDPATKTPLFTGENILFSRYLSSADWRPVRLRSKMNLRALVMVANPVDLEEYNLAPLNSAAEVEQIRTALGGIPLETLPSADGLKRATLNNLTACLRDTAYDILYIIAHGRQIQDATQLWMEDDGGKAVVTPGAELATRLRELQNRPRLVVLGSCQSAGGSEGDPLEALGPVLAEAGIPAVIAMQGTVTLQTLGQFMPVFFRELQRDGQIDRAMAAARGAVRDRPDYWMPALFLRLRSGRIWYAPGFGDERMGFEKWPVLIRTIERSQCTPILGHGLVEPVVGSLREVAQSWAETYHFPMAPYERESLPQVAQFLAVQQDSSSFPVYELEAYLEKEIPKRHSASLPPDLRNGRATLSKLGTALGASLRQKEPTEPHRVLAQLPMPIYITTNVDNFMAEALIEAGKQPEVVLCPWNEYIAEQADSVFDREKDYQPSPERPLVYHLFGRMSEPDSVVLTEDNYFDYLIGVTGNKDLIPPAVKRALVDSALIFLGFQVSDWSFRVLFRSILSGEGRERKSRYAHVAAQIEPEEGRFIEPERARRYLEQYFVGSKISMYWGSVEDFVKDLLPRWQAAQR